MRGLDLRCDFSLALILLDIFEVDEIADPIIRAEKYDQLADLAVSHVVDQGWLDFCAGVHQAPAMFADRPDMLALWKDGYNEAAMAEAIDRQLYRESKALEAECAACPGCHDESSNHCSVHG